jgi:uncharacterized membrane protein
MDHLNTLFMTAIRQAHQYTRKLWVRVVLMGLLALLALGLSQLAELYTPDSLAQSVDGAAADRLLQLIASAMLAVTIFSITVMVSVYQSSSTQWTPRVHRLIMEDRTTQNTLAVFIGAYVYALLGIILRETGVYGDDRAFVLFWMTVTVLGVIVIYLIRWVLHLQGFGQLIDTTRQVEQVTRDQFKDRLARPCLGGRPLVDGVPEGTRTVRAWESGYVRQVFPEALNEVAEKYDVRIYLVHTIGHFAFLGSPLLEIERRGDEPDWDALCGEIKNTVMLHDLRTYEQDPRFGLIVMGEIGSKALSPGVNDPGTAIDVITRIGRILSDYKDEAASDPETLLAHLYVAPLDPVDLLRDGFGALSRDGAATLEVQQRLQQTLTGLMQHPDEKLCAAAVDLARQELDRALAALTFAPDRETLIASASPKVRPE